MIGKIEKSETEEIRVKLSEYKGRLFLDIRTYYFAKESEAWRPSRKGISLPLDHIADLRKMLQLAEQQAGPDSRAA